MTEKEAIAAYQAALQKNEPAPPAVIYAIDGLFAANQTRIYAACRRIVGNEETARDLAQETLLTAYQKLGSFKGESAFSTWLFGIAKMLCLNRIRRKTDMLTEDGVIEVDSADANALGQLRRQERTMLLRQATAELSPLEQEAIHLRYVEGLPQDHITTLLEIEQRSGARGVLQKCRRTLSTTLREQLELRGHGSSFFRDSG